MKSPETQGVSFAVRVLASDASRHELLQTFRSLVGSIRGTRGCTGCSILVDDQHVNEILLQAAWTRSEDFVRHVSSDVFRKILQALELADAPPEVKVETVTGVRGLDFLRELMREDEAAKGDTDETQ